MSQHDDIEALRRELMAWREVGAELERALDFIPPRYRRDSFPDWFEPRMRELLHDPRPGLMRLPRTGNRAR